MSEGMVNFIIRPLPFNEQIRILKRIKIHLDFYREKTVGWLLGSDELDFCLGLIQLNERFNASDVLTNLLPRVKWRNKEGKEIEEVDGVVHAVFMRKSPCGLVSGDENSFVKSLIEWSWSRVQGDYSLKSVTCPGCLSGIATLKSLGGQDGKFVGRGKKGRG